MGMVATARVSSRAKGSMARKTSAAGVAPLLNAAPRQCMPHLPNAIRTTRIT